MKIKRDMQQLVKMIVRFKLLRVSGVFWDWDRGARKRDHLVLALATLARYGDSTLRYRVQIRLFGYPITPTNKAFNIQK